MTVAGLTVLLDGWADQIGRADFSATLAKAKGWIGEDVAGAFAGSHTPDGSPWAQPARPLGRLLLVKTGRMRREALAAIAAGAVTADRLHIRMDDPFYKVFHQLGTARIPARPFFGFSKDTVERVKGEVVAGLETLWNDWIRARPG